MTQYIRNLWLWLAGFRRFGEIRFRPGWSNGPRWWLLYAIDYGAACLMLGIGVQPVSRWAGERYAHQPWRWLARALNAVQALGGWADLQMVMRYAHLSGDALRAAADNIGKVAHRKSRKKA